MAIRRLVARGRVAALLSVVALAVAWGPGAQVASACDCGGPGDAAAVAGSSVAFTGMLVERIDPDPLVTSADPVGYVFDVSLVHKGTLGSRVEVESAWASASCGAVIAEDVPMLVIARAKGEQLVTDGCSGTRAITEFDGPPEIDGWPPATSTTGKPDAPSGAADVAAPETRTACEAGAGDCGDQGGSAVYTFVIAIGLGASLAAAGLLFGVWLVRRPAR